MIYIIGASIFLSSFSLGFILGLLLPKKSSFKVLPKRECKAKELEGIKEFLRFDGSI